MNFKILTGLVLFGGGVGLIPSSAAQQTGGDRPPLPSGPLLRPSANYSKWQIKYKYLQDADKKDEELYKAAPSPQREKGTMSMAPIRQVVVTRTDPVIRVEMVDVDGYNIDQWIENGNALFVASGLSDPTIMSPQLKAHIGDYTTPNFPDMQFVSPSTYVGVQPLGGHPCLVFVDKETTVWIDVDTRFPVAWRREGETRIYRELPPPQATLVVPAKFKELGGILKRNQDLLKVPPPRGG